MAKTAYAFTKPDATSLLRVAKREQNTAGLPRLNTALIPRPHCRFVVAYVGGTAITAASGAPPSSVTPGSGTATQYWIDPADGLLKPFTDSNGDDVTITVYNPFSSASQANVFICCTQNMEGNWILCSEDCG